jgi:hypothetical protein
VVKVEKLKQRQRAGHPVLDFSSQSVVSTDCLFWQENGLDVWQNTPLGNGDPRQEFVQFLVVSDGQL